MPFLIPRSFNATRRTCSRWAIAGGGFAGLDLAVPFTNNRNLFAASAETMLTIAADKKHLGARIGITSVLHTWGTCT